MLPKQSPTVRPSAPSALRRGERREEAATVPPLAASHPLRVGQLVEGMAQTLAPARANHLEVSMILGDVDVAVHVQRVALDADEIERKADRKVRADRRIHRDQRALRRLSKARAARDDAIEDRLAVLRFADLEVGRVARRLDEVARRVDA